VAMTAKQVSAMALKHRIGRKEPLLLLDARELAEYQYTQINKTVFRIVFMESDIIEL